MVQAGLRRAATNVLAVLNTSDNGVKIYYTGRWAYIL